MADRDNVECKPTSSKHIKMLYIIFEIFQHTAELKSKRSAINKEDTHSRELDLKLGVLGSERLPWAPIIKPEPGKHDTNKTNPWQKN